jgi:hypothetical protein
MHKIADPPKSFTELIHLWPQPSIASFASDLELPYVNAQQMARRNSIAPKHWDAVIAAAELRGIEGVTKALLADLATARDLERAAT